MVHYYYGYGKGKTTAAMGLALRALGQGKSIYIVQFLKDTPSGEIRMLKSMPNVTLLYGKAGKGFSFTMTEAEKAETIRLHNAHLLTGLEAARSGACDMLVLDEIGDAMDLQLVDPAQLLTFLQDCPKQPEIVMTGHTPTVPLVDAADYVTEMRKLKHPYDQGVKARRGIEY